MPTNYKVLGQSNPSTNTFTTLYTVPAGTQTVVSTITVSNGNTSSNATYSIAVRPGGETLATKHYIAQNNTVLTLDSIALTLGLSLGNTDVVKYDTISSASI